MEDFGRWDHYVCYTDRCGVTVRERVLGMATAQALAEIKRNLGFFKVEIQHRRSWRKKERLPRAVAF